jgi:UDP-N-acetylmuramate: L-alanyl-gamma-D-glutamyl-meso-diaminopimelate ligase
LFIDTIEEDGNLIYCEEDEVLRGLVENHEFKHHIILTPYGIPEFKIDNGKTQLITESGNYELSVFGKHNLMNLNAARLICENLNISSIDFYNAIKTFKGAARRLEKLGESETATFFKDFAHSPSKLKATIDAVKEQFPERKLIACIELHTFSSLNEQFLQEYSYTMNGADFAVVFIDENTFLQKKMKPFSESKVIEAFKRDDLKFFNHPEKIKSYLQTFQFDNVNLLMMSSGNFGGINLVEFTELLLSK